MSDTPTPAPDVTPRPLTNLSDSEFMLIRLATPMFLFLCIVFVSIFFSTASVSHTHSLKAFFQVTNNTEVITYFLFAMWFYMLVAPIVLYWRLQPDKAQENMIISAQNNGLVLVDPKQSNRSIPLTINPNVYNPQNLIKEVNKVLSPYTIQCEFNRDNSKMEFTSPAYFEFTSASTILQKLGFRNQQSYKSTSMSPLQKYNITDTNCQVYILTGDTTLNLGIEKLNVLASGTFVQRRTIIVATFFFICIIWKGISVRSFRNVGRNMRTEGITDEQLQNLSSVRNFYNNSAILIALGMLIYILYVTITNQDLNPKNDLQF